MHLYRDEYDDSEGEGPTEDENYMEFMNEHGQVLDH